MKKILCVDFFNIFYRGFYALQNMRNSQNVATGAVFFFIKSIKKIVKEYAIDLIVVVGDYSSKKKEKYSYYKANRDSTPLELESQKQLLFEYLQLVDIPYLAIDGFEADDILVALTKWMQAYDYAYSLYIFSGDKDLDVLLLTANTYIINPNQYVYCDYAWVKKKYWENISKSSFYLYFSLVGDKSDNIPGVFGIGPKNAEKIVSIYEDIYQLNEAICTKQIDKTLSKKNVGSLERYYSALQDSYFLVYPQPLLLEEYVDIKNIMHKQFSIEQLSLANDFLMRIECSSLIDKKIVGINTGESNLVHVKNTFKVMVCLDSSLVHEVELLLKENNVVAIDAETSSGNPQETIVLGFSLCVEPGVSWYVPLYYKQQKSDVYDSVVSLLKKYNTKDKLWIMHNALFDLHALNRIDIDFIGDVFDTMIAAHIFKENKIGLKELSSKLLLQKMNSFSEIMEFGEYATFDEVPIEKSSVYAAADAKQTLLLYHHYMFLLNQDKYNNEKNILYTIEFSLIKVLYHMEKSGIICDKIHLINEEKRYIEKINVIKDNIKNIVQGYNVSLNPMSTKQTQHFLYDVLKLPHAKSKKTDSLSLSLIAHLHPIVSLIILYRSLLSNISHFTTGLLKYIKNDGKIYTHYQQLVAMTGRITTINPNLQNIPRSNEIYKIRNAFCAKNGNVLVSFDYSQIELRVLAHFSQDRELLRIFNENRDMHYLTAQIIFKKNDLVEVTESERQIAKKINFSILYGQSAYNLSKDLQIDLKTAREYLSAFQAFYNGIFAWKERVVAEVVAVGYVRTLLGFKRIIPELQDSNKNIFESGKRIAFNTIIQGTAAEITKKAMIDVYRYVMKHNTVQMKLQIHDELLIEMLEDQCQEHIDAIKSFMENTLQLTVPLLVNVKKGMFWQ